MEKYIIIEADTNDGDYVTERTKITEEEIVRIKEILDKMPKIKNHKGEDLPEIGYKTEDIGDDDKNSNYGYITSEEKAFLKRFLPHGDPNYSGIHTIENVEIVELLEKIL